MRAYVVWRSSVSAFGLAFLVAVAFAVPAPALAQSGGVSCFRSPAKLPDSAIAKFMANPAGLLAEHPQGGPTLIGAARTLAGSDVRTVDALIALARNAAPERKADIAAGLANTAVICVWTRPDITGLIEEKIAAADDAPLSTAFHGVQRAGGTAVLGGGAGGPGGDIRRIGGAASGPGGVEPSTAPQPDTAERLSVDRRGVVPGSIISLDSGGVGPSTSPETAGTAEKLRRGRRGGGTGGAGGFDSSGAGSNNTVEDVDRVR